MSDFTVVEKRKFDSRDFDYVATYIVEERDRRKKARGDMEKQWDEIDRQLSMTPKTAYKRDNMGNYKPGMAWMPEKELPLQAQTLEILCADARRMMFPDNGPWYRAHAMMTDAYLRRVDFKSLISGDENDVPSKINQDNCDKLIEGVISYVQEQGDFFGQWDRFNAEAFSYGTGVGRVRKVKKPSFIETARGVAKDDQVLPMFFAVSLRNTYLDETPQFVMNEGHILGPAVIFSKNQKLADLILAAKNGSSDPKDEDGGWMPAAIKDSAPDKDGNVEVIKWEGDIIVPRKTVDNIYVPGALVTVVVSKGGPKVVRMAFREKPFSSYVTQPYHIEKVNSPYGVGPLMKGEPLQAAATEAFCRLMQAAILNTEPPIQYDPEDPYYASTGGPVIEPRALWAASSTVVPHKIGDPGALTQAYIACVAHYSDVTGMHAPRLGQQTVSHTTAFAKQQELSQGQVRTVDYANSVLDGAMSRVLDMQFAYLKETWGRMRDVWIPDYGGFVKVTKDTIPDACVFEIFGSAGPAEARARTAEQVQGLQMVMQIDQLKLKTGLGAPMDYDALQRMILKQVGFSDVDVLFASSSPGQTGGTPGGPAIPGAAAAPPGAQVTALQTLGQGLPIGSG